MAAVSEFVMHLWSATVSPNDHSGEGVWSQNEQIPVPGTQFNSHYAFDGIVLQQPEGLSGLHAGVVNIERQKYKCATASFFPLEHDEQQTFAKAISRFEGRDMILVVRGWGSDELGRAVNLETRVYWTKLINSQHLQWGVFAAGITEITDLRATTAPVTYDYSLGSAKGMQTASARCSTLSSGSFPPNKLGAASVDAVNTQLLDI